MKLVGEPLAGNQQGEGAQKGWKGHTQFDLRLKGKKRESGEEEIDRAIDKVKNSLISVSSWRAAFLIIANWASANQEDMCNVWRKFTEMVSLAATKWSGRKTDLALYPFSQASFLARVSGLPFQKIYILYLHVEGRVGETRLWDYNPQRIWDGTLQKGWVPALVVPGLPWRSMLRTWPVAWGGAPGVVEVQWLQMGKSLCLKSLPLRSTFHIATLGFLKPQSNHVGFPT